MAKVSENCLRSEGLNPEVTFLSRQPQALPARTWKERQCPSLPVSRPAVLPSPTGGPSVPLTSPRIVRGPRRGRPEPALLPPPPPQEPQCLPEKGARGRDMTFPSVPHPSLAPRPTAAPACPSSLQPSSVWVTPVRTCETLEFTLSGPSSGTPGRSGPGVPFALPGPFLMPGFGESGQASASQMGMFYSPQRVFIALPGLGARRGWTFFQNSVLCLFPWYGCIVFYE